MPLFPELRDVLKAAWDGGSGYVIERHRGNNLGTQCRRLIRKAGLTPWEKTFHNMRASRQTELTAQHPIHVVCEWMGNSVSVAAGHYLTVRPEDYAKALGRTALQSALQSTPISLDSTRVDALHETGLTTDKYSTYGIELVPPRGVEPLFSD